ncbi:MAG: hypothetical protein IJP68_12070 [Selenomonadaceae bacterium]|nr:hypothetical protein [Selenomonadaceae bacterium]
MKKTLALLMLAAMLMSTGCGNKVEDAAKDAQQKVEQTATEAKDAAAQKADEAKDAANKAADDAAAKAGEVKDAAAQKIDEISEGAKAMRESMSEISFNGIVPGFNVDEVKGIYGEPVETSGEELVFANGAIVNVDTNNMVKTIRLITSEVQTPKGVAVGMDEYVLNDTYGMADNVKKLADGAEYEYYRGKDKVAKLVFQTKDGFISEIRNEFNK